MKKYELTESDKDFLYRQLDGLGQMLADGLGDEPDGKWIGKEYKNICRQLGIYTSKPRKNRSKAINQFMEQRVKEVPCQICGGVLKQTRSGSFIAECNSCNRKYRLGHTSRRKRRGIK